MLWNKMDDFSRMNDCDVFSSLTLTACAVMRFCHGIDTLDWGITPFLSHLVTFVRLSYRGVPPSFHLVRIFLACHFIGTF